jgi:Ca-activated chloride channel family protein
MREALKVLAGADSRADSAASARYARFQRRERVVLISFSDRVEAPVRIEFEGQALDAARQQVVAYADAMTVKGGTAIYAALLQAEELAAQERQQDPGRFVSVVLLTDGENNVGPDLAAFRARMAGKAPARVFPILFGEGNPGEMSDLAQLSGGRVFDGRKAALALVFKEIRGYQ